jgi:glycine dehydrogenase subunit 1
MTVTEINQRLQEQDIFGGKDINKEFPELGQSALYCVTEVHAKNDIDKLVTTLKEIVA